jgi:hypothetical protein
MRDLVILFIHLIVTLARLLGPGGMRSVVAESFPRRRLLSLQEPLALGLENSDMTFFSRSQFPIKLFMGTGR